jgi:hypothetical protein
MHVPLPIEDIRRCSRNADFRAAVESLFAELDADIAARKPVCTNRGACCRFEAYGHNLFVTSVELAYFLATVDGTLLAPENRSYCAYQSDGRCTVRESRPTGCRIYFCDPDASDWQPVVTEAVLRRLEAVGRRFGLPYAYLEWTDGLRALGGQPTAASGGSGPVQVTIDIHERPSYHPDSGDQEGD